MSQQDESDRVDLYHRLVEDGIVDLDQAMIEEPVAPNIEVLGKETTIPREEVIGTTEALKQAMPDLHHHIDTTWEADGTVIVHYRTTARSNSPSMSTGPPPGWSWRPNPRARKSSIPASLSLASRTAGSSRGRTMPRS